jgi:hypothetical protein
MNPEKISLKMMAGLLAVEIDRADAAEMKVKILQEQIDILQHALETARNFPEIG